MNNNHQIPFRQGVDLRESEQDRLSQEMDEDSELESDLIIQADGDTLIAAGDIDLYHAAEFRRRVENHIEAAGRPRLDMLRVQFVDSAGLAALLSLSRTAKARGKALRIAVAGSPRRVLRITGIDRLLEIEDGT